VQNVAGLLFAQPGHIAIKSRKANTMKKTLSLQDHILIGYYLKVAHLATLKASTILANQDGKNKPAFQSLKKLNYDLLKIRCNIEEKLYADHCLETDERKLRQRYLGKLDRQFKLMFSGKNIFS